MSINADAPSYVPSFMLKRMAEVEAAKKAAASQQQPPPPQPQVHPQPQQAPQPQPHHQQPQPHYQQPQPHHQQPQAPAPAKSKISVTRTGANTTSPMPPSQHMPGPQHVSPGSLGGFSTAPLSRPPQSPASLAAVRSPAVAARSQPTRMSPYIAPRHHMNPNAVEFTPAVRGNVGGGLEALPSSTADMELSKAPGAGAATPGKMTPPVPMRRSTNPSPMIKPMRLDSKTATEIAEISKLSALNVNAGAYMPQRTLARVVLVKPSPLTLVPSENPAHDNIEMMLDDLWCLFYLPSTWGENIKEEDYNPTLVFRLDSIPTFWKVLNNIPSPTELGLSTLYLFRDGIDPKWEDKANRNGGIVKVKVTSAQVDEAWELLLCRTIGDSWSPSVRETVNGVVLKVRERAYWLELWVTKDSSELQRDIAELWQPILGASFATTYLTHSMMQERSHAAAALAAEKQKKNRRRY